MQRYRIIINQSYMQGSHYTTATRGFCFINLYSLKFFPYAKESIGKYKYILHIFSFYSVIFLLFPCSRISFTYFPSSIRLASNIASIRREGISCGGNPERRARGTEVCVCNFLYFRKFLTLVNQQVYYVSIVIPIRYSQAKTEMFARNSKHEV